MRGSPETLELIDRLRAICMALPDVSEKVSHAEPMWFVKKSFVTFADHHHDDRVAFWCAAPEGAQEVLIGAQPESFFRPPYYGVRGWLGVYLDVPVDWELGRRPGTEPDAEPAQAAPTALDGPHPPFADEWPAAGPSAPPTPGTPAGAPVGAPPAQAFATVADEGWRAASGAAAERPDELTAAGLPKRRPRARLPAPTTGGRWGTQSRTPGDLRKTGCSRLHNKLRRFRWPMSHGPHDPSGVASSRSPPRLNAHMAGQPEDIEDTLHR